MNERPNQDLSNSLILRGDDVCLLPSTLLRSYCEKISNKLKSPNTISEPPDKLYEAMLDGRTVVATDILTNEIYGFAQVKPTIDSQKKLIVNSWTSFAPLTGNPVLWSVAALAHDLDPEAQVIAKVREGNTKAQKTITEAGGVLIGHETSEQHYNPNSLQPIHKSIFDISLGTLMPSIPPKTAIDKLAHLKPEPEARSDNMWKRINNVPLVRKLRWIISNGLGFK